MAIRSIKLPNGETVEIDEWLDWPLFSAVEANGAAALDLRAFSYVVGQRIPQTGPGPATGPRNATESDTNQVARSRINQDEAFIVFAMTYEVFALTNTTAFANPPADLAATAPIFSGTNLRILQRDVMMELFVGAGISKPAASAPLSYYGQAYGAPAWGPGDALTIATGGATSLNLNYGTAGCVDPANQRRWALPVYIHSDRVMFVKAHSPVGVMAGLNQDYQLKMYLTGLKRRPVA